MKSLFTLLLFCLSFLSYAQTTAQEWYEKGSNASNKEDKIFYYTKAIQLNPNDIYAYYNRGASKQNIGRYQEAISDYDKAIQLNSNFANAYLGKGRSLVMLSRYCEALPLFTQGERLDNSLSYHAEDKKKAQQQCQPVPVPAPSPAARYALIIGNSAYLGGKSLEGRPLNDATDITARLESVGFTILKYTDLTKQQDFLEAFRSFGRQAKGAEVALFFYAGHGVEVNGENYVIPTQAQLTTREDVDYEVFPVKRVIDEFSKLQAKNSIILLDACRENPFRSWVRGDNRGFKMLDITQSGMDNLFVGYATAPGSVAQNGTGRNGVFTAALLKFLRGGQRFDDIFQDTVNEVLIQTNNAQRPFQTSSLRTRLVF